MWQEKTLVDMVILPFKKATAKQGHNAGGQIRSLK